MISLRTTQHQEYTLPSRVAYRQRALSHRPFVENAMKRMRPSGIIPKLAFRTRGALAIFCVWRSYV